MDKLTLEHIAPYLPYETQCHSMGEYLEDETTPMLFEIVSLSRNEIELHQINGVYILNTLYCDVFPILRPISDLTKEIEHKGQRFVPIEVLGKIENSRNQHLDDDEDGVPIIGIDDTDFDMGDMTYAYTYRFRFDEEIKLFVVDWLDEGGSMISEQFEVCSSNFTLIQKLYEWHFDLENLIGRGLAIDINTVKEVSNG